MYSGTLKNRSDEDENISYKIIRGYDLENFYDLNEKKLNYYYSKNKFEKKNEIRKNDILMKTLPPYKFWIVDDNYKNIIVDSNTLIIRCFDYNHIDLWIELNKNSDKLLKSSQSAFIKYVKRNSILELNIKEFDEKEKILNIKKFKVLKKIEQLNKNLKKEIELNNKLFNSIVKGENNGK